MDKYQLLSKMKQKGIVAVVWPETKESGEKTVEAVVNGGIEFIEILMTAPSAMKTLKDLTLKYYHHPKVVIGAGSVLDLETAQMVIQAGAQFVVCPNFNEEIIKICNRYKISVMPGVGTVQDALKAMELGVDILNVFSGKSFGPSLIQTFKGPLPQAELIPSSGVSIDNVNQWIQAGAIAVETGNTFTNVVQNEDYYSVTKKAQDFVQAVQIAKYH